MTVAMLPLNLAFSAPPRQPLGTLDPATAAGLLTHARRFSPPLFEVMRATEALDQATTRNVGLVDETAAAVDSLGDRAQQLNLTVERFKLVERYEA